MRELLLAEVGIVVGGNGPVCPPVTSTADGVRDWGAGAVGVGAGLAGTGAIVSQYDGPWVGPADVVGGFLIVLGGSTALVGGTAFLTGSAADAMDQTDEQATQSGCPPASGGSGGSGGGGDQKKSLTDPNDEFGEHKLGV
jgi:hypothetical protein